MDGDDSAHGCMEIGRDMEAFNWATIAQGIPVLLLLLVILWWGMRDPPGWVWGWIFQREREDAEYWRTMALRLLHVAEKLEETTDPNASPPSTTRTPRRPR